MLTIKIHFFYVLCIHFVFVGIISFSCTPNKKTEVLDKSMVEKPAARVLNTYLYKSEVEKYVGNKYNKKDSIDIAKKHIDHWINKQIMLYEISSNTTYYDIETIEKKVLEYKYSLLIYEYKQNYIRTNLKTEITQEEREEYYSLHKNSFILPETIIKCLFIQIKKDVKNTTTIETKIKQFPNYPLEEINTLCQTEEVIHYFLDTAIWIPFKDLLEKTSVKEALTQYKITKENSFIRFLDSEFLYMIKITDFRFANEIAPLSYVEKQVEKNLIMSRKIKLEKELEKEIRKKFENKKIVEIY
ncbi:MAG: hypothetical protein QM536_03070 [Chitinophagaceae bacterium]|nr:hypothetical protein [Chitinophagaceae bacterium]